MNKRLDYFDFLRGLAILMVVAIHTFHVSQATNISILFRQLLNIAVPLFLAISGFFLANKNLSNRSLYLGFLKKQLPRVYIPCILWSLPLFALNIINGGSIIKNSINLLICGFSVYYFIALIIQYYCLLPVIQRFAKMGGVIVSFSISLICVALVTYLLQIKGMSLPLVLYAGWSPLWLLFFFTGVYLGKKGNRDYAIKYYIIGVCFAFILSFIETRFLMSNYGGGFGIKVSSFIYSFLGIMTLFSSTCEKLVERFNWLYKIGVVVGRYSFGIYLSHCYVILLFSSLFEDWRTLHWSILWLIASITSFVLIYIGNKLLPKYSNYLGFK